MLELLFISISSFFIALSGAMMPGPLLAVTISEAPRRGIMTGAILVTGHGVLELALILFILSGLGSFLLAKETFVALAFLGALFLFFMGVSMFRALPTLTLQNELSNRKKGSLFLSGILLSVANPYWSLWWATIGMSYLSQVIKIGFGGIIAFFIGHILGDYVWYSSVSLGVYKGKRFLNDRLYRKIVFVCALILIGFSFYLIYTGILKLKDLW